VAGEVRWRPWRPEEVARRLAGVTTPWYVAAGWALDLWRGRQTRPHDDIEIGVPATGFPEIRRALAGHEFEAVGDGRWWPADEAALARTHQTWLRDPADGAYVLDVFREPHDATDWVYRRDPSLRLPYADAVRRSPGGVPYLVPELVLLFKAGGTRPKDDTDLAGALPRLEPARRAWLRAAVARHHPDHPWLARL
jgi:hypothetical protein